MSDRALAMLRVEHPVIGRAVTATHAARGAIADGLPHRAAHALGRA
jgi:hypothetical protein